MGDEGGSNPCLELEIGYDRTPHVDGAQKIGVPDDIETVASSTAGDIDAIGRL